MLVALRLFEQVQYFSIAEGSRNCLQQLDGLGKLMVCQFLARRIDNRLTPFPLLLLFAFERSYRLLDPILFGGKTRVVPN